MRTLLKLAAVLAAAAVLTGCTRERGSTRNVWLEEARLDACETPEELYAKALNEEALVIYTITTRITKVKESFEAEYPGLCVEICDLRSPDLVEAVLDSYNDGTYECDLVICNDNSGEFSEKLVKTGIVVPYVPYDIEPKLKSGSNPEQLVFSQEAEMLFYNGDMYESCPISNIWELTEPKYAGKIYMPSPLRSFSTYGFCSAVEEHSDLIAKAYEDYAGERLEMPEGSSAAEVFFEKMADNIVFTNSSDEVVEGLRDADSGAGFGIMVSSKLRMKELGYALEPMYELEPFCGSSTSTSVMIARGSKSVNSAKLFIRWLLGETDGTGAGYEPFITAGTWSQRTDVPDGSDVAREDIGLIMSDTAYMEKHRAEIEAFWRGIIQGE